MANSGVTTRSYTNHSVCSNDSCKLSVRIVLSFTCTPPSLDDVGEYSVLVVSRQLFVEWFVGVVRKLLVQLVYLSQRGRFVAGMLFYVIYMYCSRNLLGYTSH